MLFSSRIGGIEFARDEIRLVVVKTNGRKLTVLERHAVRFMPAETPEEQRANTVEALRALVATVKNRPATYNLAVSSRHGIVRTLTIPFKGARRVSAAVRFELEPYLAIPIEELCVDHALVLEEDGQTDVLAVALRRNVVQEQLTMLQEAGLDPEGVDIDAAALTGLWQALTPSRKGLHAVLHLLADGAILALVQERTMVYFRRLGFDAAAFTANPAAAARDVANSLRAFHSSWRGEDEAATITVAGTADDEAVDAFARHLDIPVTAMDLSAALGGGKSADNADPHETVGRWDAAIGATLGATGNGFSFSFRTDTLAAPNPMPRMTGHVAATTALALLFLAGVAGYFTYAEKKNQAECSRLDQQVSKAEEEVLKLKEQGIDVPAETYSDPTLLDVLAEIASKMPDTKVTVSQMAIARAGEDPWITIQGVVKNDADWPGIVEAMKQSQVFAIDEPDLKLAGGKSTFKIVARRKQAAEVKS